MSPGPAWVILRPVAARMQLAIRRTNSFELQTMMHLLDERSIALLTDGFGLQQLIIQVTSILAINFQDLLGQRD